MKFRSLRTVFVVFHVILACVIGTYIYSPWDAVPWFDSLVKWLVFPLAAALGLGMRYAARLQRALAAD